MLVAGASGFVGSALVAALFAAGHDVRALTRSPERYSGEANPVQGDVSDRESLDIALDGCEIAYYLVHSLDRHDFRRRDAEGARTFGAAAAAAGVERIVYLGGLGVDDGTLSPHLRSRQEVEGLLGAAGVPVVTLRAGIVIGHGGASWEIIRSMVEKVPALAVPRWALTRTQPIALEDVVSYLVGVLSIPLDDSVVFEIGGAEILRYVDVLTRVSALEGRPGVVVPVPVPAKRLAVLVASQALPLLTGVDSRTIRTLLMSMNTEVIVRDDAIRRAVPFAPKDYDQAVLAALGERARRNRAVLTPTR